MYFPCIYTMFAFFKVDTQLSSGTIYRDAYLFCDLNYLFKAILWTHAFHLVHVSSPTENLLKLYPSTDL